MGKKVKSKGVLKLLRSKYFLAAMAFVAWVSLFDENDLLERSKLLHELRQLEKDKRYYLEQIEIDAAKLKELRTSDENLEKFAREQYLMQRPNEDVFVVVDE